MLPVVILAGGLATRLRPLTHSIPKALIPIKGKPFVAHQLELLLSQGIEEVVFALGYLGEQVESYVRSLNLPVKISFSYDGPTLCGTGGALKKAVDFFISSSFFVLYGDSYLEINYPQIEQYYLVRCGEDQSCGLMTVLANRDRWDKSNVLFDRGQIMGYKKGATDPSYQYIDYGCLVLNKEAILKVSDPVFDLSIVLENLVSNGKLLGYEVNKRFFEVGSLEGIKELSVHLESESK